MSDSMRDLIMRTDPNQGAMKLGTSVDELMEKVRHDTLTQIASRAELEEVLKKIDEQDSVASLLIMDIDHFKKVNDELGHPAGDQLLRLLGERFKRHTKETDLVGRWGGEEFIWIANGLSDPAILRKRADEIRMEVGNEPFKISDDVVINKTISIGGAVKKESESVDDWIKRADEALYEAKESGRNRVVVAQSD